MGGGPELCDGECRWLPEAVEATKIPRSIVTPKILFVHFPLIAYRYRQVYVGLDTQEKDTSAMSKIEE